MTRLLDLIKGLFGLAMIALLLVGVPALLVVIVGYPLPTRLPSTDVVRAHIEDGDIPDAFLIKTLALVIWFVWAQMAIATLLELVALARGRISGRAPVMPGLQLFAGKLVASTVLIVSAFAPTRSLAAAPIVAPDVVQAPFDAVATGPSPTSTDHPATGVGSTDRPVSNELGRDPTATPSSDHGRYTTRSGDNWWDVAERLLGDGMRWSELRSLNSGRTMLTGEVIDDRTEAVKAGWLLAVPPDADPGQLDQGVRVADAWSLVDSLRPETLIYEGPTGADRIVAGPPYQVVEGDNLWDIAERYLGDPFRWPEIYEASTELTQTFGRQITDPNLIWPDSILVLPDDAVDVPGADPDLVSEVLGDGLLDPEAAAAAQSAETEPSAEELHRLAEQAIEAADADESVDPGPVVAADEEAAIDPVVEVEPVRRAGPAPSDPGPGGPDGPGDGRSDDAAVPPGALAIAGGGALLATGLLGLLSRARRLRLAETGEASIPSPPPLDLVDIETVLRDRADPVAVEAVLAAVASLAGASTRPDEPVAVPEVLRVGRDRFEAIVVDTGGPPPGPWQGVDVTGAVLPANRRALAADSERLDDVAGSQAEDDSSGRRPRLAPTLVTVGRGLLVNLEAVGLVEIDGRPESVAVLTQAIVHELAAASMTGTAEHPVDVVLSDRVSHVGTRPGVRSEALGPLVDELAPLFEEVELRLAASAATGPWGLRLVDGAAVSARPVVVVVDGAELAESGPGAELVARALDRRLPLAVVAVGPVGLGSARAAMTIEVDTDMVRLDPHGLAAVALDLDVDLILGAEALIDHARRAPIIPRPEITWAEVEVEMEAIDDLSGPAARLAAVAGDPAQVPTEETPEHEIVTERPSEEDGEEMTDRSDDEETGLLVRVLGPVDIEGGPEDLSATQIAIVAFLALAGPSTTDQIVDAIAPARPDERPSIEAELVGLGERLGPLFPRAGDGRHRVRSTITDLGSARRWLAQAGALTDERARNLLQLALSQVRGRPFAGADQRRWQWIEDHRLAIATQATSLLMDASFDLCDSAYAADDFHLALWACEVASMVDPLNETALTRQVQLLTMLDRADEAIGAVERWEADFARSAGRPAPHGPRLALERSVSEPAEPVAGEQGGGPSSGPQKTSREVATHVG